MAERIRYITTRLIACLCFLLPAVTAWSQCPMCKMSAENSDVKAGLNTGILYLLAMPFLLMGGVYVYWYFNRNKFENS